MSGYKTGFDDRKSASADAKKQQLEKLRAKLNQVDPEKVKARIAAEAARAEREAQKRAKALFQRRSLPIAKPRASPTSGRP